MPPSALQRLDIMLSRAARESVLPLVQLPLYAQSCPSKCARLSPCLVADPSVEQVDVGLFCSGTQHQGLSPICTHVLQSPTYNPHCFPMPLPNGAHRRALRKNGGRVEDDADCDVWSASHKQKRVKGIRNASTGRLTPADLQGRALLVTGPVSDGFWVRVLTVLVHATWARLNGLPIVVRYSSQHDNYFDRSAAEPGEDGWTTYFKPIAPSASVQQRDLVQLGCHASARAWEQFGLYAMDLQQAAVQREERVRLMANLGVRPRRRWQRAAEEFWSRNVETLGAGRPVIGVHMRATDKAGAIISSAVYTDALDAFFCNYPNAVVFAASDNEASLHDLRRWSQRSRHKAPVVTRPAIRSTVRQGRFTNPGVHAHLLNLTSKSATLGADVLLDTLLLSRANFLLKGTSAVAEFALYFNPALAANTLDLELTGCGRALCGSERPHWSNLSRCVREMESLVPAGWKLSVPGRSPSSLGELLASTKFR